MVDPSQYKNYILVFLFIKYLSDVWKDKADPLQQRFGNDELRVHWALSRERFKVPEHCTFDYRYQHRNDPDIGENINIVLDEIEVAKRGKVDVAEPAIGFAS